MTEVLPLRSFEMKLILFIFGCWRHLSIKHIKQFIILNVFVPYKFTCILSVLCTESEIKHPSNWAAKLWNWSSIGYKTDLLKTTKKLEKSLTKYESDVVFGSRKRSGLIHSAKFKRNGSALQMAKVAVTAMSIVVVDFSLICWIISKF